MRKYPKLSVFDYTKKDDKICRLNIVPLGFGLNLSLRIKPKHSQPIKAGINFAAKAKLNSVPDPAAVSITPPPVRSARSKRVYCNFDGGYLWDIRHLFKVPRARKPAYRRPEPLDRNCGYLFNVPICGPITKAHHYRRIAALNQFRLRNWTERIQRSGSYRAAQNAAYLRSLELKLQTADYCPQIVPKGVPNANCRATSVRQFKVPRGFIASSQLRAAGTIPVPVYTAPRSRHLVAKLRAYIRRLREQRSCKVCANVFSARLQQKEINKVKNILNLSRYVVPETAEPQMDQIYLQRTQCVHEDKCPYYIKTFNFDKPSTSLFCPIVFHFGEGYFNHGELDLEEQSRLGIYLDTHKGQNIYALRADLIYPQTWRGCLFARVSSLYTQICRLFTQTEQGQEAIELIQFVDPQMDVVGEDVAQAIETHDVTVVDQRVESSATPDVIMGPSWSKLTSSEASKSLAPLLDRDVVFSTFDWSQHDTRGKIIASHDLPAEAVNSNKSLAFSLLFKQHRYWRGDLEVTLHVNSNKFMWGQLMMCWYYDALHDAHMSDRLNIYTASTMNHVLVQAGSSNPGTLRIPFIHYNPYVPIVSTGNVSNYAQLNLGRLYVFVLNPLNSKSDGYPTVGCNLSIRFIDSDFVGMVDSTFALPNMELAAAYAIDRASSYLVNSFSDNNRDNPPTEYVPTAVLVHQGGNLAHGDALVEPLNTLRLNPRGQTPHWQLGRSELLVSDLTSVYGMVKFITWSFNHSRKTLLLNLPLSPVWQASQYPTTALREDAFYCVPPVGVVSSMFAYWRGGLDFRFDCVCNQFYTGSLLVAYVPGIVENITFEQALSCSHTIFILQEERSFSFITPFIANSVWWRRRYNAMNDEEFPPPGSLQIFVLNPLVPMAEVPNHIEINVYVRGAPDFEVSVPTQPILSSSYYKYYDPNNSGHASALPGYYPYYAGTSRYFRQDSKALFLWGPNFDHVACYTPLVLTSYYRLKKPYSDYKVYLRTKNDKNEWVRSNTQEILFAVPIKDSNGNYWLAPVKDEVSASSFVKDPEHGDLFLYEYPNDDLDYNTPGYCFFDNPDWEEIKPVREEVHNFTDWTLVQPNTGERDTSHGVVTQPTSSLSPISQITFGETFTSLTSLFRRYQYYDNLSFTSSTKVRFIRLSPTGPYDITSHSPNELIHGREGPLGLISTGFRFFRGGMRLKFMCTNGAYVYIHHIPDVDTAISNARNEFNLQGYACYYQHTSTTRTVTVEVPYYLPCIYGSAVSNVTQQHREGGYDCLGVLRVSVPNTGSDHNMDIYSCFADDARLECFQGFPPMRFTHNSANRRIRSDPQRPLPIGTTETYPENRADPHGPVVPEGGAISTIKKTKKSIDTLNATVSKVDSVINNPDSFWEKYIQNSKLSSYMSYSAFVSVISQIAHVCVNPSIPTMCISLASILASIFTLNLDVIGRLSEAFAKIKGLFQREPMDEAEPNGLEPTDDSWVAFTSVLVGLMASIVGVTTALPGHAVSSVVRIFRDVGSISRGLDGLVRIFKYTLVACKKIVDYFFMYRDGHPDVNALLREQGEEMIQWALRIEDLLDPEKEEEHLLDDGFCDRVFIEHLKSTVYTSQLAVCVGSGNAYTYISKLSDKLRSLKDKLVKMGKHPYTRPTPYSVWLEGAPGIGKSHLQDRMVGEMLSAINYTERRQPKYKVEPCNDHWDTCTNQPIFVVDDAFAVTTPLELAKQLCTYFNVVSTAPFTPPMAHLENKFLRVSPLAMISCSNLSFPNLTGVQEPKALFRRRHAMWRVVLLPHFVRADGTKVPTKVNGALNITAFTEEEKRQFVWLRFGKWANTEEPSTTQPTCNLTMDQFLETLRVDFKSFYERELSACESRISDLYAYLAKDVDETTESTEVVKKAQSKIRECWKETKSMWKKFTSETEAKWFEHYKTKVPKIKVPPHAVPEETQVPTEPNFFSPGEEAKLREKCENDYNEWMELKPHFQKFANRSFRSERVVFTSRSQEQAIAYFKNYFLKSSPGTEDVVSRKAYKVVDSSKPTTSTNPFDDWLVVGAVLSGGVVDKDIVERMLKLWDRYEKEFRPSPGELKCAHTNLCPCYFVYNHEGVEFFVPTCAGCCKTKTPQPVAYCQERCLLECPREIPDKSCLRDCYLYSISCKFFYFIKKAYCKVASTALSVSKAVLKGAWATAKWTISKIIKYLLRFLLPILAMAATAVGFSYFNKSLKGKSFGERMGAYTKAIVDPYIDYYNFSTDKYFPPDSEGATYEGPLRTRGSGRIVSRNISVKKLEGQGLHDPNMRYVDAVKDICAQNTFILEARDEDGETRPWTYVVFLKDTTALMVKHCWDEISHYSRTNGDGTVWFVQDGNERLEVQFKISALDFRRYSESNLGLLQLPKSFPSRRNIIRHIPALKTHNRVGSAGILMTIGKKLVEVRRVNVKYDPIPLVVNGTAHSPEVRFTGSYKYDFGGPGYCGSLLLSEDCNPCVVGMHVAGRGSTVGYAEPLVKEMFGYVENDDRDIVDVATLTLDPVDQAKVDIEASFYKLGCVAPNFAHNETGVSQIVPSAVHGIFPIATEPGPLIPSDPRLPPNSSPMVEGVKKLGETPITFPQHLLDFGYDCIVQDLRVKVKPVIGVEPVSIQEAICGRPGVAGFSSLNFHTSEGFPFSALRPSGFSDKRWLFDLELVEGGWHCRGIHKYLADVLKHKDSLRRNGILPSTVFVDCLKDARIPKEKCCIPGKTRIFSISPTDYSIAFRQYFLPYTVAHQNSRDTFSSSVGINIKGEEWTFLVYRMLGNSPHQLCGDYSNFGSGFSAQVHARVADAILDWFDFHEADPTHRRVRKVLLRELLNSIHLCFNLVYQTLGGMPSGSPITVETNDLVNLYYIYMAWREIMLSSSSPLYASYYYFNKFVRIKTYGDDLWLSVSPYVISDFNNNALHLFFKKYGVKYTDASKTADAICPSVDIFNVDFLKCKPVVHPTREGYWLAQLDLRSCLDIANWCWKSRDWRAATLVNLEACSDSLYGHGPSVHEHYRQILMAAANRLGHTGNFRSWSELDLLHLGTFSCK